jgi:hypothetical protein
MAKFRKVDPRIWNDAKFRGLSDDAKLIFFFALTHPNLTSLGAMRATIEGMAAEMGWEAERFRERFRELLRRGLLNHDSQAAFLLICNYLRYNGPDNPNQVKAWSGAWDLLPECQLKIELYQRLKQLVEQLGEQYAKPFAERFRQPSRNSTPNLELELELEPELELEAPPEPLSAGTDDLTARERRFVTTWNATPGVIANRGDRLTNSRRAAFRARMKEPGWWDDLLRALAKFPLKCTTSNPSGWKPDTEWVLRPDSVTRILDGKYDWTKQSEMTPSPRVGPGQRFNPDAPSN